MQLLLAKCSDVVVAGVQVNILQRFASIRVGSFFDLLQTDGFGRLQRISVLLVASTLDLRLRHLWTTPPATRLALHGAVSPVDLRSGSVGCECPCFLFFFSFFVQMLLRSVCLYVLAWCRSAPRQSAISEGTPCVAVGERRATDEPSVAV